jgi:hypothetical protein
MLVGQASELVVRIDHAARVRSLFTVETTAVVVSVVGRAETIGHRRTQPSRIVGVADVRSDAGGRRLNGHQATQ